MTDNNASNSINKNSKLKRLRLFAVVIVAFVLFIAGGAVGGGTATILILNHFKHGNYNPKLVSHNMVKQMQRRLNLSKTQSIKINKIITAHEQKISRLRRDAHSDIGKQIKQMRSDIANVLNAKQRKKWLEYFDRMNRRWSYGPKKHRHHPRNERHFNKNNDKRNHFKHDQKNKWRQDKRPPNPTSQPAPQ